MIDKDDWRLRGQEKYLKNIPLVFKKYEQYSETWDHDHCIFCWAKFSTSIQDALKEGYATTDDDHWICTDCFEDFKDSFEWTVANK